MISLLCSLGWKSRTLLAVLIVCLLPAALHAETITIKNSTDDPVVVQTAYIVKGRVFAGQSYTLKPGDTTPGIMLPGNKLFTIVDAAKPNVVLGRQGVPGGNMNLDFELVPGSPKGPKIIFKLSP
jgi:hypothetical protein